MGIPVELWGQHGDWDSFKNQKSYMKRDFKSLLSVSKAAMSIPTTLNQPLELTFDSRDDESTLPPVKSLMTLSSLWKGLPTISFRWLEELS